MTIATAVEKNFIDKDKMDWLVQSILSCGAPAVDYHEDEGVWKDQGLVARIHEWDWYADDTAPIREYLSSVLEPYLGRFEVDKSHILDAQLPWSVHNDYEIHCSTRSETPQAVVIIPIEDANSNTLVFHQSATYSTFSRYRQENPPLSKPINGTDWNRWLSHCWPKDQFWLTIDQVFPWHCGDLCVFDRQTWHASDSFHKNDVQSKRAIVLFTGWPHK